MRRGEPNQVLAEKEIERLTEVTIKTRMGYACFIAPPLGILLLVFVYVALSPIINMDEAFMSLTSIGMLFFIGGSMAYLLMFTIGLPAMMFLDKKKAGTLLNYILFGVLAGMVNNVFFWFLSLEANVVSLQCGVMCAAVAWGIMNIGNRWSEKTYW
ncbi:MAG: hypothetical protein H6858_08190 [Rhodospirillales bacterium]|nr:hypothetical protein [Alphaproteobacteria bacterium]MCB9977559.1 hypothetical protein [Rhodospirillales bacterium]